MEKKRYFWLKLKEDFFEQKEIKKLRRQEGGDARILVYLKMQLHSLKNEGKVFLRDSKKTFTRKLHLSLTKTLKL